MQSNDLDIAIYSYRFITETLFPKEQFKPQDVAPGGRLYCLTQVFLDKIDPVEKVPVELLLSSRSNTKRTRLSKTIADTFNKLIHQPKNPSACAHTLCSALHTLRDNMEQKVDHAAIDDKFTRAFEAVEACLRSHPDKLANFEQILTDWTKASPQFRARGSDFDPFIRELYKATQQI